MKHASVRWALAAFAVAFVALPGVTGCKKAAADPFPASGAVAGWQKTDETRVFAASDLWKYIDGGAEQYVSAGVVTTSTSEYKYKDQLEAVVDVHTMGDAQGASKILASGLTRKAQKVQLGDEGVEYAQSVIFRKGPYLVRIVAYDDTPETQQALMALAHGVEARL